MPTPWELNARTYHPDTRRRFADAQADQHNVFRRDGFQNIGRITPESVAEILSKLADAAVVETVGGVCQHYDIDSILAIDNLKRIALLPEVTRIAAIHIGAEPKILDVSCWRTSPGDGGREAAQRWHRDIDDWRACKLFVYLTDVGPDNGPHLFVPGSHRYDYFEARGEPADAYFFNSNSDPAIAEIVETLPRFEVCAPAGHMWIENTYGFHRGKPATAGTRVVFQVCYGLMEVERFMGGTKIPNIRAKWG